MESSVKVYPWAPLRHLALLALAALAPLSLVVEVWPAAVVSSPAVFLFLLISPEITRSLSASKTGQMHWDRIPRA
jgi:hypothetical protein